MNAALNESQRITQQRQYRGLPPTAEGGGVKGAKYA